MRKATYAVDTPKPPTDIAEIPSSKRRRPNRHEERYHCCGDATGQTPWFEFEAIVHVLAESRFESRDRESHFEIAREVFAQCCVHLLPNARLNLLTLDETIEVLGEDLVLDEHVLLTLPTEEAIAMTRNQNPNVVNIYYVSGLSEGSNGEAFPEKRRPAYPAVVVSNSAVQHDVAHEIGHVLLNAGQNSRQINVMSFETII